MLNTLQAVVREEKIELLEPVTVPEGTRALVTLLPHEEPEFWLGASASALQAVWNNPEDDIYAQLLKE